MEKIKINRGNQIVTCSTSYFYFFRMYPRGLRPSIRPWLGRGYNYNYNYNEGI